MSVNYSVFADGTELPGVLSVEHTGDRKINEYNGLGSGYFSAADSKKLRGWSIVMHTEDKSIIGFFDGLMDTKEASRLVIHSDSENTSELALIESYTKSEEFAGVYDIKVSFLEYKPVGMKTTDIPYVARPGKVPDPPKTVVFNGTTSTPCKSDKAYWDWKRDFGWDEQAKYATDYNYRVEVYDKTGNKYLETITNPALVPNGARIVREDGTVQINKDQISVNQYYEQVGHKKTAEVQAKLWTSKMFQEAVAWKNIYVNGSTALPEYKK